MCWFDIEEYEKTQATVKLLSRLSEAEIAVKDGGWLHPKM